MGRDDVVRINIEVKWFLQNEVYLFVIRIYTEDKVINHRRGLGKDED